MAKTYIFHNNNNNAEKLLTNYQKNNVRLIVRYPILFSYQINLSIFQNLHEFFQLFLKFLKIFKYESSVTNN